LDCREEPRLSGVGAAFLSQAPHAYVILSGAKDDMLGWATLMGGPDRAGAYASTPYANCDASSSGVVTGAWHV
jgi:hypothetical protein